MRWAFIASAVALVAALGSCGGSEKAGPPPTTTTVVASVADEVVNDLPLSLDEVGPGWTPKGVFASGAGIVCSGEPNLPDGELASFGYGLVDTQTLNLRTGTAANYRSFRQDDKGSAIGARYLAGGATQFPTVALAKDRMVIMRTRIDACPEGRVEGDVVVDWRSLASPKFGDEAFARRLTRTVEGDFCNDGDVYSIDDIVFVRTGRVMFSMTLADQAYDVGYDDWADNCYETADAPDTAALFDFAKKQQKKVDAAIRAMRKATGSTTTKP